MYLCVINFVESITQWLIIHLFPCVETIQFHIMSVVLKERLSDSKNCFSLSSLCLQELQAQLAQRADQYHRLLDQGESMLLARGGDESGPGTTQTQQNLSILQSKWASLNAKMDDRRVKM